MRPHPHPGDEMKTVTIVAAAAAALALPARAEEKQAQQAAQAAPHWGYEGEHGPAHWDAIAPECKTGKQQSPINIHTKGKKGAKAKELPRVGFQWKKSKGTLVNNGHTIQVNLEPGNSI